MPVGGGWVDGDQKGSIFLNFKYVDQYVLRLLTTHRENVCQQHSYGFENLVSSRGVAVINLENTLEERPL